MQFDVFDNEEDAFAHFVRNEYDDVELKDTRLRNIKSKFLSGRVLRVKTLRSVLKRFGYEFIIRKKNQPNVSQRIQKYSRIWMSSRTGY